MKNKKIKIYILDNKTGKLIFTHSENSHLLEKIFSVVNKKDFPCFNLVVIKENRQYVYLLGARFNHETTSDDILKIYLNSYNKKMVKVVGNIYINFNIDKTEMAIVFGESRSYPQMEIGAIELFEDSLAIPSKRFFEGNLSFFPVKKVNLILVTASKLNN